MEGVASNEQDPLGDAVHLQLFFCWEAMQHRPGFVKQHATDVRVDRVESVCANALQTKFSNAHEPMLQMPSESIRSSFFSFR